MSGCCRTIVLYHSSQSGAIGAGVSVSSYLLKGCKKCGGDLAPDYGDWVCLQCGAYYYVGLYRRRELAGELPASAAGPSGQAVGPGTDWAGSEPNWTPEKAAVGVSWSVYSAAGAVVR